MTYEMVKQLIERSSSRDWKYDDEKKVHTFTENVNLTIRRGNGGSPFSAPWANRFPHLALTLTYELYWGASLVERLAFVALDEYRAEVPLPKSTTDLVISQFQYSIACIINRENKLDDYINGAGITVV